MRCGAIRYVERARGSRRCESRRFGQRGVGGRQEGAAGGQRLAHKACGGLVVRQRCVLVRFNAAGASGDGGRERVGDVNVRFDDEGLQQNGEQRGKRKDPVRRRAAAALGQLASAFPLHCAQTL